MTPYPNLVRRASPEDIDSLLLFVPQVLSETSLLPVSMSKIVDVVERCAYQRSGAIAGIIDGEEGIDGSVGLAFCEAETSDVPFIKIVWCGLHPNVRRIPATRDGKPFGPEGGVADPRGHYGRVLLQFSRWCHEGLEQVAGHPVHIQFDILTTAGLGAKMGLFQRNLTQIGASFAFGPQGEFVAQKVEGDKIMRPERDRNAARRPASVPAA